jgi:hypothetical protein
MAQFLQRAFGLGAVFMLAPAQYVLVDAARRGRLGVAVQVAPIKFILKAPISQRLKLTYGQRLSSFAFKINVRRYTLAAGPSRPSTSVLRYGSSVLSKSSNTSFVD